MENNSGKKFIKRKQEQEAWSEKARQATLRAEEKMKKTAPKIEEREVKYQQDLEFQKKNNPNFRDYDENPLIIKNYERFFVLSSFLICLCVGGVCCAVFRDMFFYGRPFKFEPLSMVVVFYFAFVYLWVVRLNSFEIVFANRFIQFIDNGVVKRQIEISADELSRPYFDTCEIGSNPTKKYYMVVLFIFLLFVMVFKEIFLFFLLIFYFSNLLIKFSFYFILNKKLQGFNAFPFIRIDYSNNCGAGVYGLFLSRRYYLIYLYNYEIYKEVKKYFLQKNINIDNLPKRYSIF